MPRSKRDKKVSLTKTERKGLAWKQQTVEEIRNCVQKYPTIFVFSVQNMRNNLLKDLRQQMKNDTRFFFGKNRIMQLGLGRTKDEEIEPGLYRLTKRIDGQCGLLFTNKSKEDVLQWSKHYSAIEYARSGFVATKTVKLDAGPLEEFSHAIEPHLRSLGLPTKLEKGKVTLVGDHIVCEKGKVLTPEQARILKLIAIPMATFKLTMKCVWTRNGGFEKLKANKKVKSDATENDANAENDEAENGANAEKDEAESDESEIDDEAENDVEMEENGSNKSDVSDDQEE